MISLFVKLTSVVIVLLSGSSLILFVGALSLKNQKNIMFSSSSSLLESSRKSLRIRPFDVSKDMDNLNRVCANVYGGSDHLPKIAPDLAKDNKTCSLLVLEDRDDDSSKDDYSFVAVANYKRIDASSAWIECVRTCPEHYGRGYATILIEHLVEMAKAESRIPRSCTISTNIAMQTVFQKCGLENTSRIHVLDFAALRKLNGWSSCPNEEESSHDANNNTPETLIDAFNLKHLISGQAKYSAQNDWEVLRDINQVTDVLQKIEHMGGSGYAPGLFTILSHQDLTQAIQHQRVFAIHSDDGSNHHSPALMVLVRDDNITSLRSPWVCSVAATNVASLESAIWKACTSESIFSKMDGHKSFTLAFDGAIPINDEQSLPAALPLTDYTCMIYSLSAKQ